MNKYILCVPRDGFNDILNQINVCYQYSIEHDRILLIDCSKNYILKENNEPLHNEINDKNPVFFDALRDLVLLIHGDDLIVELDQYCGGFTRLAHHLRKSPDNFRLL